MRRLPILNYPIQLDLGCGRFKIDNHVGMDSLEFGQEVIWDATLGLPFPNDSVYGLHTSHFLEHIKWDDLEELFNEMVRVCQNGALITIRVPRRDVMEGYYLCHKSLWDETVVTGIAFDHPNLELEKVWRDGIEMTAHIRVKKDVA